MQRPVSSATGEIFRGLKQELSLAVCALGGAGKEHSYASGLFTGILPHVPATH